MVHILDAQNLEKVVRFTITNQGVMLAETNMLFFFIKAL